MARFAMQGLGQTSNNVLFSHGLVGGVAARFRVIDMMFGFSGTAADGTFNLSILRTTTSAGTSTATTPAPLDSNDAASSTAGGITFTVNSTPSTVLMNMTFNQRSTVRWFAAPGEELVNPLTANTGIAIQPIAPSPTAVNLAGTLIFDE